MKPQLSDLVSIFFKKGIIKKEQSARLEKALKLVGTGGGTPRHPTRLGLYIKDCSEKALQRAVYLSSRSCLPVSNLKREVLWGDAEVPVSTRGKAPRGSCFDLVGNSEGCLVLCELKAGKSSDHPLFAALELLVYYAVFASQPKGKELVFHENSIAKVLKWPNDWKTLFLVVAADHAYWAKWKNAVLDMSCFGEFLGRYPECKPYFFNIPISAKEYFIQQKSKATNYVPCLGDAYEWEAVGN
jgi:hypothetical protein